MASRNSFVGRAAGGARGAEGRSAVVQIKKIGCKIFVGQIEAQRLTQSGKFGWGCLRKGNQVEWGPVCDVGFLL